MTSQTITHEKLREMAARAETGEQFAEIAFLEAVMNNGPFYCQTCGVQLTEADTAACDNSQCVIGA